MSEQSELDDILTAVKDAQSPAKFNLAEVIKGRGYPEDTIDIYVDSESAYELSKLNDLLMEITDEDQAKPIEAEAKILADKIMASRMTFKMRGLPQAVVEAIDKKARVGKSDDNEAYALEYFSRLIAATIVSIENANGEVDDHQFTVEEVNDLRGFLPAESWEKLVATTQKLTLASGYFKGLTDAGFLQKS